MCRKASDITPLCHEPAGNGRMVLVIDSNQTAWPLSASQLEK